MTSSTESSHSQYGGCPERISPATLHQTEPSVAAATTFQLSEEYGGFTTAGTGGGNASDDDDEPGENYTDLQAEMEQCCLGGAVPADTRNHEALSAAAAGNYEDPWDLISRQRDLEDKLRAVQQHDLMLRRSADLSRLSVVSEPAASAQDARTQDGYDKPWDLLPHRKDDRGQEGYEKPWDLKPHMKDERPMQEYDAPWDRKARDIERDFMAAKKEASLRAGQSAAAHVSSFAASRPAAPSPVNPKPSDSRPVVEYDEPWDQKKKEMMTKTGNITNILHLVSKIHHVEYVINILL